MNKKLLVLSNMRSILIGLIIFGGFTTGCDLSNKKQISKLDGNSLKMFFGVNELTIIETIFIVSDFYYPRVVFFESEMSPNLFNEIFKEENLTCDSKGVLEVQTSDLFESTYVDITPVRKYQEEIFQYIPKNATVYQIDFRESFGCENRWVGRITFVYEKGLLMGMLDLMEE